MDLLKKLSIKQKFTLALGSTLLLIGIFIFFFFPQKMKNQMTEYLVEKSKVLGFIVSKGSSAGLMFEDESSVKAQLEPLKELPDVEFALVYKKDGTLFTHFNLDKSEVVMDKLKELVKLNDVSISEESNLLIASTPILSGKDKIGILIIGINETGLNSDVAASRWISLIVGLLVFALGLVALLWLITKMVFKPVNELTKQANKIALGDIDVVIEVKKDDEIGQLEKSFKMMVESIQEKSEAINKLANGDLDVNISVKSDKDVLSMSINKVVDTLKRVVEEIKMLIDSSIAGNLKVKGKEDEFEGAYREMVSGINNTIAAIVKPLNKAAVYVERISKGDIPEKIIEEFKGEYNEIKTNLNICIDAVNLLIKDAIMLSNSAVDGKLAVRADITKHQGDFRKIIQGVNSTLDAVISPLKVAANYVDRISKGDIPNKITDNFNGDFNELINNLNTCIDAVNLLVMDTKMLAENAVEGNLDKRADTDKHFGDFKKIVQGINDTLNAVIAPLNSASKYVNRISKGDIPEKIQTNYKGAYNEIKVSLNTCIDAINLLIKDANLLADSAVEGKLDVRGDISKHQGDFRKIIQGVNNTLDAVVTPLTVAADSIAQISEGNIPANVENNYKGEFNLLINNLNKLIDSINLLISDSNLLAKAGVDGNLSVRADLNKHHGDFRKIIQGVNETLDAVITPLKLTADYIDKISRGDIPSQISKNYPGDFRALISNLNTLIKTVETLVNDISNLSNNAVEGNLKYRIDDKKYLGDFNKIMKGVNETLEATTAPILESVETLQMIAHGDLTVSIDKNYKGDHVMMKNSINEVVESLAKAISDVNEAVQSTASASAEISSSTEQMSSGMMEQTQQANEVASAVDEMTRTILGTTKNASIAAEAAKKAGDIAKNGGKVVVQTIDGMVKISEVVMKSAETVQALGKSSDQIGEIVQVIDDIADQTNLLALNAAIEAARAGEQGRGFAVVADEVRKLAERTTKATKEIAAMIKQIQKDTSGAVSSMEQGTKEVEKGRVLAKEAGESLNQIIDAEEKVLDIITQVAAASEEQSASAEQISKNLESITSVTHESASGVQQIARAAEDLNRLTQNLQNLINKFKILGNERLVKEKHLTGSTSHRMLLS